MDLKDILIFACGCDTIPPCGLFPSPSVAFYDGLLPLASTCSNELTLPTVHSSYSEFRAAFIEGLVGSGGDLDRHSCHVIDSSRLTVANVLF